ncbi:MAG: MATE family efflux transporter [Gemmataceae bacterium]|nr:MATE family efflux transporter [Gemmataceae bacterium]
MANRGEAADLPAAVRSHIHSDRLFPVRRQVLLLAWPVLVQQFLVLAVGLSDQFLAGYFEPLPSKVTADHVAYQSAQTTANYLAWVLSSYCVFVTVGSTALVARYVGAGSWGNAIRVTNQSMVLSVGLGLIGSVVGLTGLRALLEVLQVHGPTADLCAEYLQPLLVLLVFQVIELAGIACLAGAGDTRMGLWVLGSVAVLNLPLAWLFFRGAGPLPGLGFQGIALGTAISNTLGGLAVLTVLARGRAGLKLHLSLLRPDADLLKRLLRISVPAGIDSLSVAAGHLWFLSIINLLGDVPSAAHGIALRWEGLAYLSGSAFGTAAMTLVGQNLGAGRPREAAHSGWVAFGLGLGIMCVMGVVFYVWAPEMFGLFNPNPEQQGVIDAGVPVLRLVAFAMPPLACCIIFTYALRGAGDTRVPVLFTWVGFIGVRIPLAYLLTLPEVDLGPLGTCPGLGLGLRGAWLAMFADLVVRGGFFLYRFASGRWQTMRV